MSGPLKTMRLVIREEGDKVNCYVCTMDTREGQLLIGSISVGLLNMDRKLFEGFKALMTDAMRVLVRTGMGGAVLAHYETPPPAGEVGP